LALPRSSGAAFLPLGDQHEARVLLLTDHRLDSSEALRALVAAGPDALPLLLASRGDKQSTLVREVLANGVEKAPATFSRLAGATGSRH
jgi:hypothetical protein